ncbi:MAG: DUF1080 domain-containing protein [Deltaproteobacteria bacterium]|nr:DUF1080 domain-containing protein [Deltaproteobacteria bacterium]
MRGTLHFSLILLASITMSSCGFAPGKPQRTSTGVLFADDFSHPLNTARWAVGEGRWSIKDGKLESYRHKQTVSIWVRQPLEDNYQLDFDAKDGGGFSVFLNGLGKGNALDTCYYHVGIGFADSSRNIIQRLGKTVVQDRENPLESGKWYHVTITMTDGILKVMLDGKVILEYEDKEPLTGIEHRYIALGGCSVPATTIQFDNLVIRRL